jgi:hypothetical protein
LLKWFYDISPDTVTRAACGGSQYCHCIVVAL